MSYTKNDLTRQAYRYIEKYFKESQKKHLIITGKINTGKSTLLNCVINNIEQRETVYGIKTELLHQQCVNLTDTKNNTTSTIGEYRLNMTPVFSGFDNGINAINNALLSDDEFFYIDEIGFLEKGCSLYLEKIWDLFDKKRVIAVTRKSELPFIKRLWSREDVCVFDLDKTQVHIAVAVMASGLSSRYGENKLIKPLGNEPLVYSAIKNAQLDIFSNRVLLTRKIRTAVLTERKINTTLHSYPTKAQAISLAIKELTKDSIPDGIMFLQSDQPFIDKVSLYMMCYVFSQNSNKICRLSYGGIDSSPVIFPKSLFYELSNIPGLNSGRCVIKNHCNDVIRVSAGSEKELFDIDTKEDLLKAEGML